MASTDSLPVPKKNTAFRLYFTAFDADGVPVTGFTSPDSEVSKDGGAFADCTNEATYIGHGGGYIDFTTTETNADGLGYWFECAEGNIGEVIWISPAENTDIPVDVRSYGGSAGTFSGGRPEVNTTHLAGTSQTARDIGASVLLSSGTSTGQVSLSSGAVTVGTNNDKTGYALTSAYDAAKTAAQAGDEMDLVDAPNETARHAIATTVESHLLDEGDSQLLINAIVGAIGNTNIDQVLLVAAIREDLERPGGNLNTVLSRLTSQRATNLDNLDAAVTTRLASTSYTAPDNATVATINTKLGTPAGASVSADIAAVKGETASLLARLGAFTGSGVNTVLGFFKAILGKTASTPSDVGGTFDPATDSVEAIRDRGDAAWATATGFATSADMALVKGVTDKLNTALESDESGGYQFTTLALENSPAGGGGGDATLENQTEMLSRLAAIKTVTDKEATLLEDAGGGASRFKSAALVNAPVGDIAGDGSVFIDHNYGGTDELAYKTSGGAGIDNAVVQAFTAADYEAGNRNAANVQGETKTNALGRWVTPLALDPGDYVLIYYKQGFNGPDRKDVTVAA